MKVLVVLVLAMFTGCHAMVKQPVKTRLEQLSDSVWNYCFTAKETIQHSIDIVVMSQLGDEFKSFLTQNTELASQYLVYLKNVQTRVYPVLKSYQNQLPATIKLLQQSLAPYKEDIFKKVEPYTNDVAYFFSLFKSLQVPPMS